METIQDKIGEKKYAFHFPLKQPVLPGQWAAVMLYAKAGSNEEWYKYPHHVEWTKVGQRQHHQFGRGTGQGIGFVERFILPCETGEITIQPLTGNASMGCELIRGSISGRPVLTLVMNNPAAKEFAPYRFQVEFTVDPDELKCGG